MCRLGSRAGVKPRRLRGCRGFTQPPENSKRAHLTSPALPNTTKIPERHQKSETVAGKGRKSAKFWAPPFGAPQFGAPPFGLHPSGVCGPLKILVLLWVFLLCSSWKEEGRTRLYHFGSKKVGQNRPKRMAKGIGQSRSQPQGICPTGPMCSGSNTNCADDNDKVDKTCAAADACGVPKILRGHAQTFSSCRRAKSSVSSGLTARNQKFALVAPHMERRRRRNADCVSLTQGMRWKSTCCCLVLCTRNSCTYSCFPMGMPKTFTPCWVAGSKGSPRQTTASSFNALAALVILCSKLGSCRCAHGCGRAWPIVGPPSCALRPNGLVDTRCKCHPRTPSRVLRASCSRGWLQRLCVVPRQTTMV